MFTLILEEWGIIDKLWWCDASMQPKYKMCFLSHLMSDLLIQVFFGFERISTYHSLSKIEIENPLKIVSRIQGLAEQCDFSTMTGKEAVLTTEGLSLSKVDRVEICVRSAESLIAFTVLGDSDIVKEK